MAIDIPKFLRAEAQRAELFAELVKRGDRLNNLEQAEADSLAAIEKNRSEADAILASAAAQARQDMAKASEARQAAQEELGKARAEAERIIADARAQGERELAAARGKEMEALKAAEAAHDSAADAERDLLTAKELLAQLEPRVAEAQAVIAKAEALAKLMKA